MNTTSNAVQVNNREFFRQRESAALRCIPGVHELMNAKDNQRSTLEQKYPDAAFALQIFSNSFIPHRELGTIQMEAYSAILNCEPIADVHYNYDRQVDDYLTQHNWD